jgi:hypothetical protein
LIPSRSSRWKGQDGHEQPLLRYVADSSRTLQGIDNSIVRAITARQRRDLFATSQAERPSARTTFFTARSPARSEAGAGSHPAGLILLDDVLRRPDVGIEGAAVRADAVSRLIRLAPSKCGACCGVVDVSAGSIMGIREPYHMTIWSITSLQEVPAPVEVHLANGCWRAVRPNDDRRLVVFIGPACIPRAGLPWPPAPNGRPKLDAPCGAAFRFDPTFVNERPLRARSGPSRMVVWVRSGRIFSLSYSRSP